jgi:hypothetical protein
VSVSRVLMRQGSIENRMARVFGEKVGDLPTKRADAPPNGGCLKPMWQRTINPVAVTTFRKSRSGKPHTLFKRLKLVSQRRPSKDFQSHRKVAFFCAPV